MEQTRSIQPEDIEFTRLLKIEANEQRRKRIEEMTQQFENDMQPDDIPYTVFADHLTDSMTFVQGLRNAGFEIHEHVVPSHGPETVMVTFSSGAHAKRAMLALHLRHFKGKLWDIKGQIEQQQSWRQMPRRPSMCKNGGGEDGS
ncbi:MAG: hypothetical protein ASARMPREDX12_006616 [Alectoria sarmentosa]|nr:MAG: hypothetical protein ASARMPREDX12_006616 [Alectoria sarmentosa]